MVSRTGEPDWAALYQKHRDAMYRVAARVLREAGLAESAEDAVMDAMTSLMNSPPTETVRNWEAVLVTAAKRKALDLLRSAAIQHRGPQLDETHDTNDRTSVDIAEDVAQRVDDTRLGAILWDKLSVLDQRDRQIVWEVKALGRRREEVAAEYQISPARVSQICTSALKQLKEALDQEGVES